MLPNEIRQKVEQLPVEADRRSITIDLIWETVRGPLYQALLIASRSEAYLRYSIRAVNTRLTESVEKTLSGLFAPSASSVPNPNLFPVMLVLVMEGLAIGVEAREKRVIEQVMGAAKNVCRALFTPRSAG